MYIQGSKAFEHHVATHGPHTEFGYKGFIPQLTAANFDADAWAALFKQAGAKFVVPAAEHWFFFDVGTKFVSAVQDPPEPALLDAAPRSMP